MFFFNVPMLWIIAYDIILLKFHSVCWNWNLTFYFMIRQYDFLRFHCRKVRVQYPRFYIQDISYMLDIWLKITYINNFKKTHMLWNWKSVCEKLANDFGSDRCNCQMFEFKVTAYNKFITTGFFTGPVGRYRVYI